jgi:hypothetical protein
MLHTPTMGLDFPHDGVRAEWQRHGAIFATNAAP